MSNYLLYSKRNMRVSCVIPVSLCITYLYLQCTQLAGTKCVSCSGSYTHGSFVTLPCSLFCKPSPFPVQYHYGFVHWLSLPVWHSFHCKQTTAWVPLKNELSLRFCASSSACCRSYENTKDPRSFVREAWRTLLGCLQIGLLGADRVCRKGTFRKYFVSST